MADRYIFEVHTDADVIVKDGRKHVPAKYLFDWETLKFRANTDPTFTRQVTSRHNDGRVFVHIVRMFNKEFSKTEIPRDLYVEGNGL
jgi:hypothetical protein